MRGIMAEVARSIYFYKVEMLKGEWHRKKVLEELDALTGDDRLLELGSDDYAWAKVDHIPSTSEAGRLRFFRDRRANLPGMSEGAEVKELPISEEAGLVEPTHVVLGRDGLIAAEYNHFAPRITSQFALLLRECLGYELSIGTLVLGNIIEQLDRLEGVQLLEFSLVSTPELEEELRNTGPFGDAAVSLSHVDDGKRLNLRLSGDKDSDSWGAQAVAFAKRLLGLPAREEVTKVLRVTGYDPASENVEVVDLLKQKLVRKVEMERSNPRCKALDVESAYKLIEEAISEVRKTDLPDARVIY
jgi:hypothetical protein